MPARKRRVGRVWRGRTSFAEAHRYQEHLRKETLPRLQTIEGFEQALVLRRADDDDVEFLVLTLWAPQEPIRRFAGRDDERAVVPPATADVLKEWDERARHFEVALQVRAEST
jgi:heme-degrading monooxygenase HmoA